jgi:hypothetical protein
MKLWCRIAVLSACLAGSGLQAQPPDTPAQGSALTGPLFYQLLLGELNVRQGAPGAGFSLLLDAARKTREPALFQRAIDVALQRRVEEEAQFADTCDVRERQLFDLLLWAQNMLPQQALCLPMICAPRGWEFDPPRWATENATMDPRSLSLAFIGLCVRYNMFAPPPPRKEDAVKASSEGGQAGRG